MVDRITYFIAAVLCIGILAGCPLEPEAPEQVPRVEAPIIYVSSVDYYDTIVRISCYTAGAVIHFTTDGSTPTESSPTYGYSALRIDEPTTIKAIAVRPGFLPSDVSSGEFDKLPYTHISSVYEYSVHNEEVILTRGSGLTNITEYVIPETIEGYPVTAIGDSAFYLNDNLLTITVPDSVQRIGASAFKYCYGLESLHIPEGVPVIEAHTFDSCYGLESIVLPDSVRIIGGQAFYNCEALTSVSIPDNVVSLGYSSFSHCTTLESVIMGDTVEIIGDSSFFNCESLTAINIPASVTVVGERAFYMCDALPAITLGDNVTSIGEYAFYHCDALASVVIKDKVTAIGDNAFGECSALMSVIIHASEPPVLDGTRVFDYSVAHNGGYIYVPAHAVETYKSAAGWSEYADHIVSVELLP